MIGGLPAIGRDDHPAARPRVEKERNERNSLARVEERRAAESVDVAERIKFHDDRLTNDSVRRIGRSNRL